MGLAKLRSAENKVVKMHGLGNDFVVMQDVDEELSPQMVKGITNRRRGVGSDGVIAIMPKRLGDADYRMKFFNSDGTTAEMCGNGIRCFGKYLYDYGLVKNGDIKVDTDAGLKTVKIVRYDPVETALRVDMGQPIFENTKQLAISSRSVDRAEGNKIFFGGDAAGRVGYYVGMGNPHVIFFVKYGEAESLARSLGPTIEKRIETFPQKTNVEFVEMTGKHDMIMHVWERGEGITQACGTGACASVVAAISTGRIDDYSKVHLPGGDLFIHWNGRKGGVYMTGPATTSFEIKNLGKYLI